MPLDWCAPAPAVGPPSVEFNVTVLNRSMFHRILMVSPCLLEPRLLRSTGVPASPGGPPRVRRVRFFYRRLSSTPLDPELLRLCSTFFSYVAAANPFRISVRDLTRLRRFRHLRCHHITSFWANLGGWKLRFFFDSLFLLVYPNLVLRNIRRPFSTAGGFSVASSFSDVTYVARLVGDDSDFSLLLDPLGVSVALPKSFSEDSLPFGLLLRRISRILLPRYRGKP